MSLCSDIQQLLMLIILRIVVHNSLQFQKQLLTMLKSVAIIGNIN